MKRVVYIIFLLLVMFIPFNVGAVSIKDSSVMGVSEKKVGETVSMLFKIEFSDIDNSNPKSLGIWLVGYELIFDDTVFSVVDISSSDWVSNVYKENGKYYVLSEVGPDARNMCMNGAVFCDDYFVTIDFFIKDTDKDSSTIKMGDIEVGLLDMQDENKEYTLDDLITITSSSGKSQTINIKHDDNSNNVEIKEPATILEDKKPETNIKEVSPKKETNNSSDKKENVDDGKSGNNYLKSLEVKDYKIDFDKTKNDYEIEVDELIESLEIKVVLEDSKASYKIIGANDLAKNNNKAIVEVTAENGDKNNYTVQVKIKENVSSDNSKTKDKSEFKIDDKYLIGGGIILSLVIVCFIIISIRNRRIEKALDRL